MAPALQALKALSRPMEEEFTAVWKSVLMHCETNGKEMLRCDI